MSLLLLGEVPGEVTWASYSVHLTKPLAGQCQEVISKLKDDHQRIYLSHASPDIVYLLMSQLLDVRTINHINIQSATVTKNVIVLLSQKLAINFSLITLWITDDSINDDGVCALAQTLIKNKVIICLYLANNPGITSASARSLAELLLYSHTLSDLYLHHTNIDTDGVLVLMESLRSNTKGSLCLDKKQEQACYSLPYYETIKNRIKFIN